MNKITLPAPAKINLFLEIKAKRPDGYHDIESVMQTVSLFDDITLTRDDGKKGSITLTCSNKDVPCDESNLCHKAARLFFEFAEICDFDAHIHIEKRIPMAAGLGGGSSDGAATLLALNKLYGEVFAEDELCSIGSRLGADVPFCIKKGTLITRGIGDVFEECAVMPHCHIVIACEGEGVSTPWAYKKLDEMYDFALREASVSEFAGKLESGDLDLICGGMTNIFETAVLPIRQMPVKIKGILSSSGAVRAMMSGSGPSVFGIFKSEETAKCACEALRAEGITPHLCRPYFNV